MGLAIHLSRFLSEISRPTFAVGRYAGYSKAIASISALGIPSKSDESNSEERSIFFRISVRCNRESWLCRQFPSLRPIIRGLSHADRRRKWPVCRLDIWLLYPRMLLSESMIFLFGQPAGGNDLLVSRTWVFCGDELLVDRIRNDFYGCAADGIPVPVFWISVWNTSHRLYGQLFQSLLFRRRVRGGIDTLRSDNFGFGEESSDNSRIVGIGNITI